MRPRTSVAMDVRTKPYPPLPTPRTGGPRLSIVLPTKGDLRLRPLLPAAFLQQFVIHCNAEHRQVYAKFLVVRKFIVMSSDGDLYTQAPQTQLRMEDLPGRSLLPLPPPLAPWDVVKVLDLVQCYTFRPGGAALVPNVRWELVRVRWRNNRETWVPVELMASQSPTLLQEFYVNSINSWGFHDRVYPQSLAQYRTEVELWLHQPEFQKFYQQLRRRRALLSANRSAAPASVDVKDRRLTMEAAPAPEARHPPADARHPPPPQPSNASVPAPATPAVSNGSASQQAPGSANHSRIPHAPAATGVQEDRNRQEAPSTPSAQETEKQKKKKKDKHMDRHVEAEGAKEKEREKEKEAEAERRREKKKRKRERAEVRERERRKEAEAEAERRKERKKRKKEAREREREREDGSRVREKERSSDRERVVGKERANEGNGVSHNGKTKGHHHELTSEKERHGSSAAVQKASEKEKKRSSDDRYSGRDAAPNSAAKEKKAKRRQKDDDDEEFVCESDSDESDSDSEDSDDSDLDSEDSDSSDIARSKSRRQRSHSPRDASRRRKGRSRSPETPRTRNRRRKRLKWSQAEEDSESDDLLELSQGGEEHKKEKKRKRLRRHEDSKRSKSRKDNEEIPIVVIDDSGEEDEKDPVVPKEKVAANMEKPQEEAEEIPMENEVEESDSTCVDGEEEDNGATILLGMIQCECGVTKVGRYTGQWLQCWKEECAVWQHAECVGLLVRRVASEPFVPEKYECSKCNPAAFQERYSRAKSRLRAWMGLCCESRNQKQLIKLLDEEEMARGGKLSELEEIVSTPVGEENRTLLMEAARAGLTHVVRRLVRRYTVNVFATDAQSRNALHYAALGASSAVAQLLAEKAPALICHQDLLGQMPVHLMLRSSINSLCLPLLQKDQALCLTSDFDGVMPIHFACQVVNEKTVEIVRLILKVQSSAGCETSPDGLSALHYLCGAASAQTTEEKLAKTKLVQEVVELLLDVDVLGSFLNARDQRGVTPLLMAAETDNHALLEYLCLLDSVEVDAITSDSGETALHLSARVNHPDNVRVLLENRRHRFDPTAADASRFIPVLRATNPSVIEQFLHFDLDGQLHCLSDLVRNFRHHEALRRWLSVVVADPNCYAIVNDWLQSKVEVLDELDEVLLLHRSFARVDNKLDYLYYVVHPLIKPSRTTKDQPESEDRDGVEVLLSSTSGDCYWQQFVMATRDWEPVAFRQSLRLMIARGESKRLDNITLALVRLLCGLLQPVTGLLERDPLDQTVAPSSRCRADDVDTLRGFYVLGEFVASLVLEEVALGEIFEFSTPFLERVVGVAVSATEELRTADKSDALSVCAESFAAGFAAVVPATLPLLHAYELRMLFNARSHSFSLQALDWTASVEWVGFQPVLANEAQSIVEWWKRLMNELIEEEQVALLLWLCGSFRMVQQVFFAASDSEEQRPRVRIERFGYVEGCGVGALVGFGGSDDDELLPMLDTSSRTLVLPRYSTYERLRSAVLRVFRAADYACRVR